MRWGHEINGLQNMAKKSVMSLANVDQQGTMNDQVKIS